MSLVRSYRLTPSAALFVALGLAGPAAAQTDDTAVAPDLTGVSQVIVDALAARERKLASQRAEAAAEQADLEEARAQIDARIKQLEALIAERRKVEKAILAAKDELLGVRISRLVKVAEKMTPDAAARYLAGFDDQTAASIVEGMSIRRSASVLSAMKPSRAAKLSRIYLTREPRRNTERDQPANAAGD